jgi:glutaredoxin
MIRILFRAAALVLWLLASGGLARAAEPAARCLAIDVYIHGGDAAERGVAAAVRAFAATRGGIAVRDHDLDAAGAAGERLAAIARRLAFDAAATPVVVGCNRVVAGVRDTAAVENRLRDMCGITLYTRAGCARCLDAKAWLPSLLARYPAFAIATIDIGADAAGRAQLEQLVKKNGAGGVSVPVLHVCNSLVVGFDTAETTGRRIEQFVDRWAGDCPPPRPPLIDTQDDERANTRDDAAAFRPRPPDEPIPQPRPDSFPDSPQEALDQRDERPVVHGQIEPTVIDAPALEMFNGRLDPQRLGMPLFTLAVGLIDGFNPCAMWVLLLLLSILVNLKDRWRILAIAGTFVVVSGAAYFAFMAAWLNVFQWIGYVRPVQVCLGLVAVVIGVIHVKDFFAFKQGVSLSIPEAAKPGIYDRMRRIVNADNLPAAIAGAFTLAVLVNIVELLCTAGLPAVYTSILSQQGFSAAGRYGYLLLYILAYMFDDAVMVAGVVWTLSRLKLQETGGRWLKLVSGGVILLLGLTMLFKPEWLA